MKSLKLKDIAAVFVIVCLLPYVISIVLWGFPGKEKEQTEITGQAVSISYDNRTEKITLQQYLIGVLAAQVPVDYEMELLKAQAVLARTSYVFHEQSQEIIVTEESTQGYLTREKMKELWGESFETYYKKFQQAVVDTGNKCMYYNGTLCEPYFHAVSAGMTRSGSQNFGNDKQQHLKSVACDEDLLADNYVTIKSFTDDELEELCQQLKIEDTPDHLVEMFNIMEKDDAGYVKWILVNNQQVHGEIFRKQLNLPSAAFQVEEWEDGVRFVCKGLGHGWGMSLYTGNKLAEDGMGYEEILHYFFENITIK